jgi:sulfite oxidase
MPKDFDRPFISRREFARMAGAAGLSVGLMPAAVRLALAQPGHAAPNPAQVIQGISPEMIIHNAKLLVMETPLSLLRKYKHTPKEILFTRYHFAHEGDMAFATTAAPHGEEWTIRVGGLVQRPSAVSLDDLMKRPQEKRVSVLQCAGNGRAYYAAKQKVPGGQWHNGGMGNVEWEGVSLRPLLADLKLLPSARAHWLTAQPWDRDEPAISGAPGFAKSYHLADPALDHAILALKMNGEPIPAVHGGPVRLIIPGFYGNMNVKMVSMLLFASEQSPSVFQSVGYRMPLKPVEPGQFKFDEYTIHNSVPTYGHRIKSVIFSPLLEDKPKAGDVTITGVAFNDGMAKITTVEVSLDGGKSWREAAIEPPESPWAWHHWSLAAPLGPGKHVLASRATDALGRTQPIDGLILWNPRGYEWNGVERVEVDFS